MANLLIVDDDPDIAEPLAEILRLEGHDVRLARHGLEGLRLLTERASDILLLDLEMPILDGFQTAVEVFLRDNGLEKIPIVLLSGHVNLHGIAARIGTPYALAKPFTIDSVLLLVARALREGVAPKPARS